MSEVVLHYRGRVQTFIHYLLGFCCEVFGATMCLTSQWPARGRLLDTHWIFSAAALWVRDRYFKHAMPLQVRCARRLVKYVCMHIYSAYVRGSSSASASCDGPITRLQFQACNLVNSIAVIRELHHNMMKHRVYSFPVEFVESTDSTNNQVIDISLVHNGRGQYSQRSVYVYCDVQLKVSLKVRFVSSTSVCVSHPGDWSSWAPSDKLLSNLWNSTFSNLTYRRIHRMIMCLMHQVLLSLAEG